MPWWPLRISSLLTWISRNPPEAPHPGQVPQRRTPPSGCRGAGLRPRVHQPRDGVRAVAASPGVQSDENCDRNSPGASHGRSPGPPDGHRCRAGPVAHRHVAVGETAPSCRAPAPPVRRQAADKGLRAGRKLLLTAVPIALGWHRSRTSPRAVTLQKAPVQRPAVPRNERRAGDGDGRGRPMPARHSDPAGHPRWPPGLSATRTADPAAPGWCPCSRTVGMRMDALQRHGGDVHSRKPSQWPPIAEASHAPPSGPEAFR